MTQRRRERRIVDGFVLLDKPRGLSSNAALQRVKRIYSADKAGHTGSLDPLATGLLPICFGQATKLGGFLLEGDKRYQATLKLGTRTTTGDIEGEVVSVSDPATLDRAAIEAARGRLVGPILQIPPMHSAIKIDGEKLYRLARQGLQIERRPRPVTILELALIDVRADEIDFEVLCSKGTYIRTLAEDWAAMFGQCAHLTALRRIAAGPFVASQMVTLEAVEGALHDLAEAARFLLPTAAALVKWQHCRIDDADLQRIRHGHPVQARPVVTGDCAVFGASGRLLCLGVGDGTGDVQPRRWLGDEPV